VQQSHIENPKSHWTFFTQKIARNLERKKRIALKWRKRQIYVTVCKCGNNGNLSDLSMNHRCYHNDRNTHTLHDEVWRFVNLDNYNKLPNNFPSNWIETWYLVYLAVFDIILFGVLKHQIEISRQSIQILISPNLISTEYILKWTRHGTLHVKQFRPHLITENNISNNLHWISKLEYKSKLDPLLTNKLLNNTNTKMTQTDRQTDR